eukprot:9495890-Pyramimonas_sp.AAC.1
MRPPVGQNKHKILGYLLQDTHYVLTTTNSIRVASPNRPRFYTPFRETGPSSMSMVAITI